MGRHPPDERDLQEQDEERREKNAERTRIGGHQLLVSRRDAELLQRFVRTSLPFRHHDVAHVLEIGHAHLARQEPGRGEVAEAVEERDAVRELGLRLLPATRCRRARRCAAAAVQSRNRLSKRSSHSQVDPGQAAAHRASAAPASSTIMKSMNSGTPASVALPDRSSFGMIRSTSTRTVAYSCAVKNFGLNAARFAGAAARGLRRLRGAAPPRPRST